MKKYALLTFISTTLSLTAVAEGFNARCGATPRVLLQTVLPEYPSLALKKKIEGHITLAVTIDPQGRVTQSEAFGGHRVLVAAARKAAKNWTFAAIQSLNPRQLDMEWIYFEFSIVDGRGVVKVSPSGGIGPIIDDFESPLLIHRVEPDLSKLPPRTNAEIRVHLRFQIDENGDVVNVCVLRSSDSAFDQASIDAVSQWKYRVPRLRRKSIIRIYKTVTIRFQYP